MFSTMECIYDKCCKLSHPPFTYFRVLLLFMVLNVHHINLNLYDIPLIIFLFFLGGRGLLCFVLFSSCSLSTFLEQLELCLCFCFFFFYQGFPSRTLATHRTAREGRGPSFIPLYHFHPLTNIQTFICNFACEMTITYF